MRSASDEILSCLPHLHTGNFTSPNYLLWISHQDLTFLCISVTMSGKLFRLQDIRYSWAWFQKCTR